MIVGAAIVRLGCAAALLAAGVAAGVGGAWTSPEAAPGREVIVIDGSQTIRPIMLDAAERTLRRHPQTRFAIEGSGTGSGFRRFCAGETDIQAASRPIRPDEAATCAARGIAPTPVAIGLDGLTVIANPSLPVACLTVGQLEALWRPGSWISSWSELDPSLPAQPVELHGPEPGRGSFDAFTAAITGEAGASRTDYAPAPDDAWILEAVATRPGATGYVPFAAAMEAGASVRRVAVDGGNGCVLPSPTTIAEGSYAPLTRKLYLYVDGAGDPATRAFVSSVLANAADLTRAAGHVPLGPAMYGAEQAAVGLSAEAARR